MKADTQSSDPRVHSPEERSKAKEVENYRYTSVPKVVRLKLFRTIISVNQLSIYGAVSDVCDEYSACQPRTERPVLARKSDPLFEPARFLHKKIYCKRTKNESKCSHNKIACSRFVLMQDS